MFQDLKFGLRMLAKKPGFTAIAVITMALGIGANTAIFSVVNAVLLNPLPFPEPERLITIYGHFRATSQDNVSASVPEFTDYRERTQSFEQIAGYDDFSANLTPTNGDPERVEALLVTPELFSLLVSRMWVLGVRRVICDSLRRGQRRLATNRKSHA